MDTSGDGIVNVILYIVVLALFLQIGIRMLRASHRTRSFPIVACAATILIGVPSLLQFVWPGIGESLRRDPPQTLGHGEWWRVFTSIAAQDGGLVAAIFNLVVIAVVVTIAEWLWGRWRTVVLFLLPSVLLNLLALTWGATGGGSSFASDGLLASVCGLAIVVTDRMVVRLCALAVVAIGLVLIVLNDAHGVAIVLGAVLGVVFALPRRRRTGARELESSTA